MRVCSLEEQAVGLLDSVSTQVPLSLQERPTEGCAWGEGLLSREAQLPALLPVITGRSNAAQTILRITLAQ